MHFTKMDLLEMQIYKKGGEEGMEGERDRAYLLVLSTCSQGFHQQEVGVRSSSQKLSTDTPMQMAASSLAT